MEYRQLGRTGIEVSAVGFGCGGVGGLFVRGTPDEQLAAVQAAIAGGITYFDTAAQYGDGESERNLGRALGRLDASPVVGTKFNLEPAELPAVATVARQKLVAGLERLGRDHVDVCTLHGRIGTEPDSLAAGDVTGTIAHAMRALVAEGLCRAIGFTGLGETGPILEVARSGVFDTVQCYYNVLNQSAARPGSPDGLAQDFEGLLGIATSSGTAAIGIRALAGGALGADADRHPLAGGPGRAMARGEEYDEDERRALLLHERLREFGASSLSELALRFALGEARISTVLVGFSDEAQVLEALRAARLGAFEPAAQRTLETIGGPRSPSR